MLLLAMLAALACGSTSDPTPEPSATSLPEAAPTAEPSPEREADAAELRIVSIAFDLGIQDFAHQNATVTVGSEVVWTNRDNAAHTTTGKGGDWDSGRLGNGQSFAFKFTKAGSFGYFCSIHTNMTGTITVEN